MTTFQKQQLAGLVFLFLLVVWLVIVFGFHLLDSQSAVAQWGIAGQLFVCGLVLMLPMDVDWSIFISNAFFCVSAILIAIFVPHPSLINFLEVVGAVFSGIGALIWSTFTVFL